MLVGTVIYWLIFPLTWLRDQLQGTGQSVWVDFAITAAVVSLIAFVLGGGVRTGWRAFASSIATFIAIAIVIKLMGLDHGGLPIVQTNLWGGLLVTLVVSVTGIVTSLPIGIALALGPALYNSADPDLLDRLHRVLAWRAADHRAVLRHLHAALVPAGQFHRGWSRARADRHRAVHGRLSGRERPRRVRRDPARTGRGGGRPGAVLVEDDFADRAAAGVAPRHSRISSTASSRCSRTPSLVSIVALFDLLGSLRASFSDPKWSTPSTAFTGFAFAGIIYFIFCFGMSRYSLFVEHRLNAHRRN